MKTKIAIIVAGLVGAGLALAFVTSQRPAAPAAASTVTPVVATETAVNTVPVVEVKEENSSHDCGSCNK